MKITKGNVDSTKFFASDAEVDEDEEEFKEYKFDCNQLRRRISAFLALKVMTQTAFLTGLNVNSNSFRRFMSYKTKFQGTDNCLYSSGNLFFMRMDAALKKLPKAQQVQKTGAKAEQHAALGALKAKMASAELPDELPVYDDCNVIRK